MLERCVVDNNALYELSNALQQLTRGIEKMLIVQKVKVKHLGSAVEGLLENGKRIHDMHEYRNNNPKDKEAAKKEFEEALKFAKEHTNGN